MKKKKTFEDGVFYTIVILVSVFMIGGLISSCVSQRQEVIKIAEEECGEGMVDSVDTRGYFEKNSTMGREVYKQVISYTCYDGVKVKTK